MATATALPLHHGPYHFMPPAFMRSSLHGHLPPSPHYEELSTSSTSIPTAFDSRTHFASCTAVLSRIRNQGHCGSCWAFGAVESLADRICIASGGKLSPKLSAQSLIDCDRTDSGCQGGFIDYAWEGLMKRGALAETCDPYEHCAFPPFENCTKPPGASPSVALVSPSPSPPTPSQCPQSCASGAALQWFKAASAYAVAPSGDVAGMQRELMAHGPFEVAFFVYSDFYDYTGGVYRVSKGAQLAGSHAVKIVGWGEDEHGAPYWIVANSWSPEWGEQGFFRIARGVNECGIESTPAAGLPLLPPADGHRVSASPRTRPPLQLQFAATMRVSESDHGDGCVTARKLENPVVSPVWFDAKNQRIAQTNAGLAPHPIKPMTQVTRFDVKPPASLLLEPFFNETICYEKPLDPSASWGRWGELCPFTSVFGMFYPNTTFLEVDHDTGDELWQWQSIKLTPMPNGSVVNITRNYTYHVAPAEPNAAPGSPRGLRRYEWTQGLPNGGDHSFRFCAVFDYTLDYKGGPLSDASFGPPKGVKCVNPGPTK